jgi:hypothetical protein
MPPYVIVVENFIKTFVENLITIVVENLITDIQ